MKIIAPISDATLEAIFAPLAIVSSFHEHGTIFFFSKADFLYRFEQLTENTAVYKKLFKTKILLHVDASLYPADDSGKLINWFEKLNRIPDIVFISGLDGALMQGETAPFSSLQKLAFEYPKTSLFMITSRNPAHSSLHTLLSPYTFLLQNFFINSLYGKDDCKQFISYLEAMWQIKLNEKTVKYTVGYFSHLWLIKEAVRQLRDNQNTRVEEISNSSEMQIKLMYLWNGFSDEEKDVLRLAVSEKVTDVQKKDETCSFLLRTGYIVKRDRLLTLAIPALSDFIRKNEIVKKHLELQGSNLTISDIPVDAVFTKKENSVLIFLLKNHDTPVTRERIASLLWDDTWEETYSDWAIDKAMSRIRKKLEYLGVAEKIQTLRNRGYQLSTNI